MKKEKKRVATSKLASPAKMQPSIPLTFISQIMGASLLSMPFIVRQLGYVLTAVSFFVVIIFVVILLGNFTEVMHYLEENTYRSAVETLFGKGSGRLLNICEILSTYGFCTGYVIISSNAIVLFVQNQFNISFNKILTKAIISFCLILPLTTIKSITIISKAASLSGIIIFIISASFFVEMFLEVKNPSCGTPKKEMNVFPTGSGLLQFLVFLMYIPNIQANFGSYNEIAAFLRELQGPSIVKKRVIKTATTIGVLSSMVIFLAVGFSGAVIFGNNIESNIFMSFSTCNILYFDILSLFYAVVVIIAFPLVLFPIKQNILGAFQIEFFTKQGYFWQIIIGVIFVVLSFALAAVFEDIVVIFGLFSSLAGFVFIFLFPIMMTMKLPQLRKEYAYLDEPEEADNIITDPVIVPIISSSFNMSIQKARQLSIKLFAKESEDKQEISHPKMSFLREETLSFKKSGSKTECYKSMSKSTPDIVLEARAAVEEVEQEIVEESNEGDVVKMAMGTKIIGSCLIAVSACICAVGVYKNVEKMIDLFAK